MLPHERVIDVDAPMRTPLISLRFARMKERAYLKELQRRSSLVWEEYRVPLLANPDAIEVPAAHIRGRHLRVADQRGRILGFATILPSRSGAMELDSLFVEPKHMRRGIGRALILDAARLARRRGARRMLVTANPRAEAFYVKMRFVVVRRASTRFGPANRMALDLSLR
jgi:GNAT superfamily N-acetyltransferase